MGAYAKTAPGERLTYRPPDLSRYEGERFCLRITPEDIDLERCFFVYLDEKFEDYSLRRLFQTYFVAPKPDHVDEMESWLEPWLRIDPMLPKKYMLLRQMIAKVHAQFGEDPVLHQPRAWPRQYRGHRPQSSRDQRVRRRQLRRQDPGPRPRVPRRRGAPARAGSVGAVHTGPSTSGATGPTSRVRRRRFVSLLVMALIALFTLPLLLFSCRGNNNGNAGGGFGGGML